MAEILGVGCTHRPLMLRPNEDWTFMMRAALDDPAMPEEMKNPANWPAPLREELGNDWGASAAARGREVYRAHFAEARRAIDEFKPDLIVMWGDDQYENFKEDIVPPFAVLAYDDQDFQPWAAPPLAVEPVERAGRPDRARARPPRGRQIPRLGADRGRHRCRLCLQAAASPDGARLSEHGAAARRRPARLRLSARAVRGELLRPPGQRRARAAPAAGDARRGPQPRPAILDPPGPNPHRCMQVGAAAARVMANSPWRVAFVASSSWSHSFLTEKNWQLWPDVAADRRLYDALASGDYAAWHRYTTDQIEDSGQHEVLNWFCLLGRDGGTRPQARQIHLYRDLGLRLAGRVRVLSGLTDAPESQSRRKPGPMPATVAESGSRLLPGLRS